MYDDVYGAFLDYYGNIIIKYIKTEHNWNIYGCKINSGLNIYRYLFIVLPSKYTNSEYYLNEVDWVSFQTRMTYDLHNVPSYDLLLDEQKKNALKDMLKVLNREEKYTLYLTNTLPIKVKLMHDPKKNTNMQYPDALYLYQALESYECVVELF